MILSVHSFYCGTICSLQQCQVLPATSSVDVIHYLFDLLKNIAVILTMGVWVWTYWLEMTFICVLLMLELFSEHWRLVTLSLSAKLNWFCVIFCVADRNLFRQSCRRVSVKLWMWTLCLSLLIPDMRLFTDISCWKNDLPHLHIMMFFLWSIYSGIIGKNQ